MSKRMVAMMVVLGVLLPAFASQSLAQGPQEGIKVHGHWVIDVRNPDGTTSSHVEFENALLADGASTLALILGRGPVGIGGWAVMLTPSSGFPFGNVANSVNTLPAFVVETAVQGLYGAAGGVVSPNLVLSRVGSTVVLTGSATALYPGAIGTVSTTLVLAVGSGRMEAHDFSGTSLPAAVALVSGQIIQVTVTLSFS